MRKIFKITLSIIKSFVVGDLLIGCGNSGDQQQTNFQNKAAAIAENVELSSAVLGEIEFENASTVNLNKNGNQINITGRVDAMSAAQKNAFGDDSITHVVVLKFTFDTEKTVSSFELKGNVTKVFSTNESDEISPYPTVVIVAYCYLILSAGTSQYTLKTKYTDETTSTVIVNMNATLTTANAE